MRNNNNILYITLSIIAAFIFIIILSAEQFNQIISNLQIKLIYNFGNSFFIIINIIFVALLIIAFSKLGKVKLGDKDSTPEYSNFSWYAMIFSAGMGIGIMFYSVAEPLNIRLENHLYLTNNDQVSALATTYFSWGFHAWVIYVLVGVTFAYFTYVKKLPLALRSVFYPIFKDKIYGILGDIIDSFAIILILFALASSLGIGSLQINSGLNYLFGVSVSPRIQILIIIVVILLATLSVLSGVGKGVRILSEYNLKLVFLLGVIIFLLGPSLLIIENLLESTMLYVTHLPQASYQINNVDKAWAAAGPIFYMAWWISWSIFVGIFIAKISKGRTIREFILSILIIPTIITIIWFCIVGTTAMHFDINGSLSAIVSQNVAFSLFALLENISSSQIVVFILELFSVAITIIFFITSADSGSIVVNELANKGSLDIQNKEKIFWTAMQGFLTVILIMVGGYAVLALIQNLLIIISLPFLLILLYMLIVLIFELIKNKMK